jgi:opacity protein-like surface antigen
MRTKVILAAAALALSYGVANAADKSFDGFYLGGQGSYAQTKVDGDKDKSISGSVIGGYGKEFGKWYIGGELGLGYSGVKASTDAGDFKRGVTGSAAVRAGYEVAPGVLGYGVLGLEGAKTKISDADVSEFDYGLRYGVGVEAFVKKNISVRTELSYIDWKGKGDLPSSEEIRGTVGVGYHF